MIINSKQRLIIYLKFLEGTPNSRNYDSTCFEGPQRRKYDENGRSNLYYNQQNSPNVNQLTPSRIESPLSSISSGDSGNDQFIRYDAHNYQKDNERMMPSSHALSKSTFGNDSRLPVSQRMDDSKRQKLDNSLANKKLTSVCQVCGDQAPEHIHYGSVSCFSCRAFFRRSVSKSHMYVCPGNKRCSIVVTTRKNCQYCRYHTCLKAGMRPTWVLTDKEKQERIKNKTQIKNGSDQTNETGDQQSFTSRKEASFNLCKFTPSDDRFIHDITLKQGTSECKQEFGNRTSHAIAKCFQTDTGSLRTVRLPRWAALEIFRVQYIRFSKFANLISDFNSLTKKSQDLLLQNNLGAVAIIRLANIFKQKANQTDTNLNVPNDGGITFKKQLCEMGFDAKMANELGSQVSQGPNCLTLEQVFRASDLSHLELHRRVFQHLNKLISRDDKSVLLYQIINLFNTSSIGAEIDPIERRRIEAIQEKWTTLLLGYLQRKFGYLNSMMVLPKIILLTFELKLLSEKSRIDE